MLCVWYHRTSFSCHGNTKHKTPHYCLPLPLQGSESRPATTAEHCIPKLYYYELPSSLSPSLLSLNFHFPSYYLVCSREKRAKTSTGGGCYRHLLVAQNLRLFKKVRKIFPRHYLLSTKPTTRQHHHHEQQTRPNNASTTSLSIPRIPLWYYRD